MYRNDDVVLPGETPESILAGIRQLSGEIALQDFQAEMEQMIVSQWAQSAGTEGTGWDEGVEAFFGGGGFRGGFLGGRDGFELNLGGFGGVSTSLDQGNEWGDDDIFDKWDIPRGLDKSCPDGMHLVDIGGHKICMPLPRHASGENDCIDYEREQWWLNLEAAGVLEYEKSQVQDLPQDIRNNIHEAQKYRTAEDARYGRWCHPSMDVVVETDDPCDWECEERTGGATRPEELECLEWFDIGSAAEGASEFCEDYLPQPPYDDCGEVPCVLWNMPPTLKPHPNVSVVQHHDVLHDYSQSESNRWAQDLYLAAAYLFTYHEAFAFICCLVQYEADPSECACIEEYMDGTRPLVINLKDRDRCDPAVSGKNISMSARGGEIWVCPRWMKLWQPDTPKIAGTLVHEIAHLCDRTVERCGPGFWFGAYIRQVMEARGQA